MGSLFVHRLARRLGVVVTALVVAPGAAHAAGLYASNFGGGQISPFSIAADGSLTPITCVSPACDTGTHSEGVAMTPDGRFLYVANAGVNTVSVFSVATDGSLTKVTCSTCTTGAFPERVAITPDGRHLYVTDGTDSKVSPFSINADGTLTAIACTPTSNCADSGGSAGLAITPDGRFLYGVSNSTGAISAFTIASDGSIAPIGCGGCTTTTPTGTVEVTPDGRFLYVAAGSGLSPFSINGDGSLTAVSCNASDCQPTGSTQSNGLAMTPNGKFLYASNEADNVVRGWSIGANGSPTLMTCTPSSNCQPGTLPDGLAIDPTGTRLYAGVFNAGKIAPFAIAPDGSLTPIACGGSNCNAGQPSNLVVSPDQAPTASFTSTAAPAGSASTFDAGASTASSGRTIGRYGWSFGDGSTATNGGANPTHTYAAAGTYTVTLTVADDAGCSSAIVSTGQTVSCNGGPSATTSRQLVIAAPTPTIPVPAPVTTHNPTPPTPPDTRITKSTISPRKHTARFVFAAIGRATTFQCALVSKNGRRPSFVRCASPKTYRGLKTGRYTFEVRAVGSAGPDPTPASKSFTIARH